MSIPLQLAPGVGVDIVAAGVVALSCDGAGFDLRWGSAESWSCTIGEGWVSPSYGIKLRAPRLEWERTGDLLPLRVEIEPSA